MRRLALALALALALVVPVAGCPEQRPAPTPRRPPQAVIAAGAGSLADALTLRRPDGPEWFGLYLVGKKAGWTRTEIRRELRDGRDVVVGRTETLIRAGVGGKEVERRQEEERIWEARVGGRLLSFRATWAGDGGDRTVTGTCERAACKALLVSGASRDERTIADVKETVELADAARLAAARRGTVAGSQLDLEKLRVREVRDQFVRRDTIAGGGVSEEVGVVTESEAGDRLAAEYRVADDGRILEIRLGEAVVARPEPEETARRLDRIDLFTVARVPLPRALPRDVPKTIAYRLTGLPPAFQKGDARQRFEKGTEGSTVLVVSARRPLAADPVKDTPLEKAKAGGSPDDLAATPQVNSDAPAIRALAKEVAGRSKGTYEAARKLSEAVHDRLQKVYGASHDRASDVLVAGEGDCTEHTVLLVALARALGIPAREVHGLVYARYGDGQDALYWHAWAEIRSAGEWIALDPTFGQPVADATHLALGSGSQVDTVGLLGTLKVNGVEVRDAK
ncbi:MAG TPA: transglutaminase domain-containing protein [Anaeromyxobacter sp.]